MTEKSKDNITDNDCDVRSSLEILKEVAEEQAKNGDWSFLEADPKIVEAIIRGNEKLKRVIAEQVKKEGFEFLKKVPESVVEELIAQDRKEKNEQEPNETVPPREAENRQKEETFEEDAAIDMEIYVPYDDESEKKRGRRASYGKVRKFMVDMQESSKGIYVSMIILSLWLCFYGKCRIIMFFNFLQIILPAIAGAQGLHIAKFRPQKVLWGILAFAFSNWAIKCFVLFIMFIIIREHDACDWSLPFDDGDYFSRHAMTTFGTVDINERFWLKRTGKTLELCTVTGEQSENIDLSEIEEIRIVKDSWGRWFGYVYVKVKYSTGERMFFLSRHFAERFVEVLEKMIHWTCDGRDLECKVEK